MSKHKPFLCLLVLYFVQFVYGNDLKQDECKNVCAKNLYMIPLVTEASYICQRGCRIFNLIDAKGNISMNKSRNDCHSSCVEAYGSPDFETCSFGCSEMQKKRQVELSKGFILYIEQDGQNNFMLVQPEVDQIDLDLLADPGLQGQLEIGYSEYKIPETRIRTMPIEGSNIGKSYPQSGDWLDCASKNSGIPRMFLISAILVAVLLVIWLIFATEKLDTISNELTDQESLMCDDPPPKYSLEKTMWISSERQNMKEVTAPPHFETIGRRFSENKYSDADHSGAACYGDV